jgi:PPM family protein phosphatase
MVVAGCGLEFVVLSDVGRVRTENEDAAVADARTGVAIVADGMGGHRGGRVASRLACNAILAGIGERNSRAGVEPVRRAVDAANAAILAAAEQNPARHGMGTTLALVRFGTDHAVLAHVGDSRVYRLRAGKLSLLTRDDSLLSEQVDQGLISAGQSAASHNRHLITAALGLRQPLAVHIREEKIEVGDIFLVCSDGLHDMVGDDDTELILKSLHMNLPLAAHHLVQLANDHGGFDNISLVLARVTAEAAAPRGGWLGRLLRRWR